MAAAGTGGFTWTVDFDGEGQPLKRQQGGYDLARQRSALDYTYGDPASGRTIVFHMRERGSMTYLQAEDWGPLHGCWMRISSAQMSAYAGATGSGLVPGSDTGIAGPVLAVVTAQATGTADESAPAMTLSGTLSGSVALQMLGLGARQTVAVGTGTQRARVPVTLTIGPEGRAQGLSLDGDVVENSLDDSGLTVAPDVRDLLSATRATIRLSDFGRSVSVPKPAADQLAGQNGDQATPCADAR